MTTALIGYTGFVGSNLAAQGRYDAFFNTKNIDDIRGRRFDLIVSAGVSAVKWLANKEPENDRAGIAELTRRLETVTAREFVLISTIDVYPSPVVGVDEDSAIDRARCEPYGGHRLDLEAWVRDRFPLVRVIRLPGLFGPGLKKNFIYDELYGKPTGGFHPDAAFQMYDLTRIGRDVETARENDLRLVNVAPAPVTVREVYKAAFGRDHNPPSPGAPAHYDMRSKHAALFGGADGWFYDHAEALRRIVAFVAAEKAAAGRA